MPYCGHVRAGGVGSLRSTDEAAEQRGEPSAEAVEGRRRPKENFALSSTGPTQSGEPASQGQSECADSSTPSSKGRAVCGNSARTDLCGGRFVRIVPTATCAGISRHVVGDERALQERRERTPS